MNKTKITSILAFISLSFLIGCNNEETYEEKFERCKKIVNKKSGNSKEKAECREFLLDHGYVSPEERAAATKKLTDTSTFKPYTGPSQWLKFDFD